MFSSVFFLSNPIIGEPALPSSIVSSWMFSRSWSHLLTCIPVPTTLLAVYTKPRHERWWRGGDVGAESSGQRSRQVITGQANRGSMEHEKLPSLKRSSNTRTLSWITFGQKQRRNRRQGAEARTDKKQGRCVASRSPLPERENMKCRVKPHRRSLPNESRLVAHNKAAANDTVWWQRRAAGIVMAGRQRNCVVKEHLTRSSLADTGNIFKCTQWPFKYFILKPALDLIWIFFFIQLSNLTWKTKPNYCYLFTLVI